MSRRIKQYLIAFFTFIGGLYLFLEYVLPAEIPIPGSAEPFRFGKYYDEILNGLQMMGVMTIGLGIMNILQLHGTALLKARRGWINSLALLFGFFAMLSVGILEVVQSERELAFSNKLKSLELFATRIGDDNKNGATNTASRIDLLTSNLGALKARIKAQLAADGAASDKKPLTKRDLDAIQKITSTLDTAAAGAVQLQNQIKSEQLPAEKYQQALATISDQLKDVSGPLRERMSHSHDSTWVNSFSRILTEGFWEALGSAMFSLLAFYIASAAYRSFRIRSVEALIMMITALIVILGQIPFGPLYIWQGLPEARLWLLKYVNVPAFRAIYFGSAIAGLAMAIRMWLSLEPSPLAVAEGTESNLPKAKPVGRQGG